MGSSKGLRSALSFVLILLCSSCVTLFRGPVHHDVTLRSSDPGTEIHLPEKELSEKGELSVDMARDKVVRPIHLRKEGYRMERRLIMAHEFPPVVGVLLAADLGAVLSPLMLGSFRRSGKAGFLAPGGLFVLGGDMAAAGREAFDYPDPYELSMHRTPVPYRDSTCAPLRFRSLSFDLENKDTVMVQYRTPWHYKKRKILNSSGVDLIDPSETVSFELDEGLTEVLDRTDRAQRADGSLDPSSHRMGLKLEVTELHYHLADVPDGSSIGSVDLEVSCALMDPYGTKVLDSTMELSSGAFHFQGSSIVPFEEAVRAPVFRKPLMDGLELCLYRFLGWKKVQEALRARKRKAEKEKERSALQIPAPPRKGREGYGDLAERVVTVGNDELGSACIVSPDGYLLTDLHLVAGKDSLNLTFKNGAQKPGRVVREDRNTHLALVEVDSSGLSSFKVSKESDHAVGREVMTIGTSGKKAFGQSVTRGILSGKKVLKGKQHLLTDAPLTRQHRGGALVEAKSRELIGILLDRGSEGIEKGDGVAIAAKDAFRALDLSYSKPTGSE